MRRVLERPQSGEEGGPDIGREAFAVDPAVKELPRDDAACGENDEDAFDGDLKSDRQADRQRRVRDDDEDGGAGELAFEAAAP
ncbi:MAG: hypothetical protein AB7P52_06780 [Alphaproteobacteria bacterium]